MQGNHQAFKNIPKLLNLVNTAYGLKCLPELQRMMWGETAAGNGKERDRRFT